MKRWFVVLFAVALSGVLAAAESIPEKFFILKQGQHTTGEVAETEPGNITLKMISCGENKGNYIVICHNNNTIVKAGTTLSFKVTPAANYGDGTHFTPSVSYSDPGSKKWIGKNGRGTLLHKGFATSLDLVKDLKLQEGSLLRQIKFVVNAVNSPLNKEIKVVISDLKLVTPDTK